MVATLVLVDGGSLAPQTFAGALEVNQVYVLAGRHAPSKGVNLFDALKPPRLQLPRHHAVHVEWVDGADLKVPEGLVRLTFLVEAPDVSRVDERRWNSSWRLRLVGVGVSSEP